MKLFEQPSEIKGKDERLLLRNKMQTALAFRKFGEPKNDEDKNKKLANWISNYSKSFREFMEKTPGLLEEFRDNPEIALQKAEKILYAHKND
jgi:hypothetical protein